MAQSQDFTVLTPSGRALAGRFHLPDRAGRRPVAVLCHGFKGFFEWGFHPYLAQLLAARGLAVVQFNFWGAGMRPGEDRVSDLDAFRAATLTGDRDDLLAVLEAVTHDRLAAGRLDPDRLALVGHSRGGGTALLAAAHPRFRERVRALVTWAAVSTFERFSPAEIGRWRRDGVLTVLNARTGQELPLGLAILADVEAHRAELDLFTAASARTAPWLIVHGEEDTTVPPAEGRALRAAATGSAELLTIPGADHTLGARHPFAGPTPALVTALNATQTWLLRSL